MLGELIIFSLVRLSLLHLSETIPSEIGLLSNLEDLWIVGENLDGSIPSEIGKLSSLSK